MNLELKIMILPQQTHSLNVAIATKNDKAFPDTDALITLEDDLEIGVRTADCVPVTFYSPDIPAVGVAHAGWRGTLGGIVDNVVDRLTALGGAPENVRVRFGVSICCDCYEVGEYLARQFAEAGFEDCIARGAEPSAKPHLDLQEVNVRRLLAKGVREENIERNKECTRHTTDEHGAYRYFSWRRTPGIAERNITSISQGSIQRQLP